MASREQERVGRLRLTSGLRDVRGGCAADVATATCIRVLPFRGVLQTRSFSQAYQTKASHALYCLRWSPDPQMVKLRFARNGCAPMRGASGASYRAMRRNVPSSWAQKLKTTSGTLLSTGESNRRTAQPARRPEEQAASAKACGHTALSVLCARAPCRLHD
jgi:hypothetical protein